MKTTIKLEKKTKERLDKLKEHSRESYEEVLKKILHILNIVRIEPDKASSILERIEVMRKKLGLDHKKS